MSIRINFLFDDFCFMLLGKNFEKVDRNFLIRAYAVSLIVSNDIEKWLSERPIPVSVPILKAQTDDN